jgi:DNA-binding winged helix-turn-helix (wHTH) protein/TolB-like protein
MVYRFGVFIFDDRTMLLTRADREIALEPQPARALALLLARAGDIVTREELRSHLWDDATHVDFDRGLAYCIGELRSALGDAADNPRFVQTLPRRGFRFIAPVQAADAAPAVRGAEQDAAPLVDPAPSEEPAVVSASNDTARPQITAATVVPGWIAAAVIGIVALIVGAAGALMFARDRPPARPIVAVAMFENETGDASHKRAVDALSDVIVERLTALGPSRIGVNGNAPILRRPRDARDWRAVSRDTRAAFLVSGLLQAKDGRLWLLMQLIRLDDGTHVWFQRISRPAGDPLDTIDAEAAAQIEAAVVRLALK